jgi:hypothetical protein
MEIDVAGLIDTLDEQALLYGESDASEHRDEGLRLQVTANCLRRYRDTLVSIANCQAGMPSHAAQEALIKTGHCAHFNSVYRYREEGSHECSKWICHDCEKESDVRLMPFK